MAMLKQYNQGKLNMGPCPTVREFYAGWIERQVPPLVRPSRTRDHKQVFNRHILPFFGNYVLTDIKVAVLRVWQAELLKKRAKGKDGA